MFISDDLVYIHQIGYCKQYFGDYKDHNCCFEAYAGQREAVNIKEGE